MGHKPKKPQGDDIDSSPSVDRTSRFAVDALIRKYGYKIHRREKDNDPQWIKGGVVIEQKELLETLGRDEVADAEYEEYLYGHGSD